MQGGIGIPAIRWAGSEGDYNVLVSDHNLAIVPNQLKLLELKI